MDTKDVNKSVQDEQFGGEDTFPENNENFQAKTEPVLGEEKAQEKKTKVDDKKSTTSKKEKAVDDSSKKDEKKVKAKETKKVSKKGVKKTTKVVKVKVDEPEEKLVEKKEKKETKAKVVGKKTVASKKKKASVKSVKEGDEAKESKTVSKKKETKTEKKQELSEEKVAKAVQKVDSPEEKPDTETAEKVQETSVKANDEEKKNLNKEDGRIEPEVDYAALSKDDLVKELKELLNSKSIQVAQKYVDVIKINFYKRHKVDTEAKRKAFLEEGGTIEDFKLAPDPKELELKELLKKFRNFKATYNRDLEGEKDKNLQDKYQVIEEIKELINSKESINETFHIFRELQKRWRIIGIVPQQKIKDLWETYHHHVEKFYDYIKINKELRDIDLKKNQELKNQLCEKAEELLLESSVVSAFKQLQKYHEQWREIGPVPNELKANIWERFKEATSKINKKHQEYFQELKKAEQKNLEAKTHLCEQVEELFNEEIDSLREWNKKSKDVVEIQKVWRTIGFAPKKHNNKIYTRFREACDNFFSKKRAFFADHKQEEDKNLQLKVELCIQGESLKESTDWKKTTEELIELQKQWKEIGPVSRKDSDAVWKRFRAACDHFFNKKSTHFSQVDTQYEDNLKMKRDLIKAIEEFKLTEDLDENFITLKGFQKRWTEIGFVPFKFKDEIQNQYRAAINKQFDELQVDDKRKSALKFRNKLDTIKQKPKSDFRIEREREKFVNKLKKLEGNLVLWENNIGFFTSSKNADSMIESFKVKIEQAKKDMEILKNKIRMIDEMEDQ